MIHPLGWFTSRITHPPVDPPHDDSPPDDAPLGWFTPRITHLIGKIHPENNSSEDSPREFTPRMKKYILNNLFLILIYCTLIIISFYQLFVNNFLAFKCVGFWILNNLFYASLFLIFNNSIIVHDAHYTISMMLWYYLATSRLLYHTYI